MFKVKEGLHKQLPHLSKADLHIHSNYSDAYASIEEILEYVENETDLAVIAITDHDKIEGALKAEELVKNGNYRFKVIIGEEVSSKEGHIVGLFLSKRIPPKLSAHETIERIHKQGGLAVSVHPLYHSRMNNNKTVWADGVGTITLLAEKDNFDAIETVNATPTYGEENLRAKFLNRTLIFRSEVGSSDAHIVDAIGKGYTLFEGKTPEELRTALEENQTQAMNDKWDLMGLFRYAYFFYPRGLRVAYNTLIHGRRKKRLEIIKFPPKWKLKKEFKSDVIE